MLAWVARRLAAGRSTYQLKDESKAGAHGWPLGPEPEEGEYLGQNASEKAVAIVRDRKRRGDTNRRRQPKESGKRLRELHLQTREGRAKTELWDLQVAVTKAVSVLEWFDLPEIDWSEHNEMLVAEIYDDLARHAQWTDRAIDVTVAHLGELGRRRKITMLEARANDPSSTPNERASAARLGRTAQGSGRLGEARRMTTTTGPVYDGEVRRLLHGILLNELDLRYLRKALRYRFHLAGVTELGNRGTAPSRVVGARELERERAIELDRLAEWIVQSGA